MRVDWKKAPFRHLQALPTEARPVTGRGWQNQDEAFADVAQGIRKVVEELHSQDSRVLPPRHEEEKHGENVGNILHFAAYAYPTHPGDPAISHVNFTIGWNGYWQVACVAHSPAHGSLYGGDVDLRQLDLPPGELRVSFDVCDQLNNVNLARQGKRTIRWIAADKRNLLDLPKWLRRVQSK